MVGGRSEKFQEAFERFEKIVDIDDIPNYRALVYSFEKWAGKGYDLTNRQLSALEYEAERRGITDTKLPRYSKRTQFSVGKHGDTKP